MTDNRLEKYFSERFNITLLAEDIKMITEIINTRVCEHCGNVFNKNTTWQKYCSSDCRTMAWEEKTGVKLKFKKKGESDSTATITITITK
jgi:hypothetical protein